MSPTRATLYGLLMTLWSLGIAVVSAVPEYLRELKANRRDGR